MSRVRALDDLHGLQVSSASFYGRKGVEADRRSDEARHRLAATDSKKDQASAENFRRTKKGVWHPNDMEEEPNPEGRVTR